MDITAMPSNHTKDRPVAARALRACRAQAATLYRRGLSPLYIMKETHNLLDNYPEIKRGSFVRGQICVAVWFRCPRGDTPTITDQLRRRKLLNDFGLLNMWEE